jgi:hypothetical protein
MTHRDRDASMERLLREAREMMTAEVRPGSECLDAEALAAWSEGALLESERLTAEAHASRCSRCQAALAAMARTLPPPAPAASPLRRWLVMLAPAAAAAAAVSLWFVVDRRANDRPTEEATQVAARAPQSPPPSAPTALSKETAASPRANEASKDRAALADRVDVDALKRLPESRQKPAERKADTRTEADAMSRKAVQAEPAATAPPPPPLAAPVGQVDSFRGYVTPSQQAAQSQAPPQQQPGQQAAQAKPERNELRELEAKVRDQQQAAAAAAPSAPASPAEPVRPPPTAVGGATANAAGADAGRGGALAESVTVVDSRRAATVPGIRVRQELTATFEVVSPTASTRWRIVDGLTVERSTNTGATWARQHRLEPPLLLVAGASPTPVSCWLVGRRGVVLRTTDGRTWQQLKFPEPVDLRAISVPHPDVATVVTSDGRTFSTANAGATWVLQK